MKLMKKLLMHSILILTTLCSHIHATNIKDFEVKVSHNGSTHKIELYIPGDKKRIAYCDYDYPCFLNKKWAYFGNIFVEKNMRKQGIGQMLCKYLITLLRNQNCERLCGMALPDYEGQASEKEQLDSLVNFYTRLDFIETNTSAPRNTMLGVPMHYDLK